MIKNAEKLASGAKFKGVPVSQLPFTPLNDRCSTQTDSLNTDTNKKAKSLSLSDQIATNVMPNVLPLTDKAEDIFIDEDL